MVQDPVRLWPGAVQYRLGGLGTQASGTCKVSFVFLAYSVASHMAEHESSSIGGNTGTVNSFTGVNLADVTGGVLNGTTLLEGNNLLCFVFEVLKFASPNALAGLYKTLAVPLDLVNRIIAVPLLDMSCPAFKDMQMGGRPLWDAIKDDFPGAMKSGGAL